MSQSGSSPAEQLAFLRSLAVAGQDAPLTAGPYLVAGGAWFGVASLFHWAVSSGLLDLEPSAYGAIWIAAALGFGINLFLLVRRDSDRPESGSNRALNAVWTAIGYSMFVAPLFEGTPGPPGGGCAGLARRAADSRDPIRVRPHLTPPITDTCGQG